VCYDLDDRSQDRKYQPQYRSDNHLQKAKEHPYELKKQTHDESYDPKDGLDDPFDYLGYDV